MRPHGEAYARAAHVRRTPGACEAARRHGPWASARSWWISSRLGSTLLCRAGPHGADYDSREGRPAGTGTRSVKRLRGGRILHGLCGGAMRRVGDFGVDALEQRHARNRRSAESSTPARKCRVAFDRALSTGSIRCTRPPAHTVTNDLKPRCPSVQATTPGRCSPRGQDVILKHDACWASIVL